MATTAFTTHSQNGQWLNKECKSRQVPEVLVEYLLYFNKASEEKDLRLILYVCNPVSSWKSVGKLYWS